jgi:hypothetical protein
MKGSKIGHGKKVVIKNSKIILYFFKERFLKQQLFIRVSQIFLASKKTGLFLCVKLNNF